MENTDKTPPPTASGFSLASFSEDLWFRYAKQIVIAVVIVVVAAVSWFGVRTLNERRAEADNKKLGQIYVLLREENLPAAEQALVVFLAADPSGLARDKANLFLGKVYFSQQRYEEAATAYSKVSGRGEKAALLHAGALHGLAASRMQLGDYAAAAKALEELIADYAARTGDPAENLAGEEVVDL
jgi:TolA-binding protein